jgi:diguanylate cyclase (GGDEF)-like protein
LLCDLNGFKKVNDNYGHLIGNKLLKEVAVNLKATCREYDHVGRLGGDEFVFLLPECTPDAIEDLKDRLRHAVEAASLSACPESVVTLSIGCAFHPADGSTVDELLAEADQRMYLSKESHYKQLQELERMPVKNRN